MPIIFEHKKSHLQAINNSRVFLLIKFTCYKHGPKWPRPKCPRPKCSRPKWPRPKWPRPNCPRPKWPRPKWPDTLSKTVHIFYDFLLLKNLVSLIKKIQQEIDYVLIWPKYIHHVAFGQNLWPIRVMQNVLKYHAIKEAIPTT